MKQFFTLAAILTAGLLFTAQNSQAAVGDTTSIMGHSNVDMTWFGNYDGTFWFPTAGKTYQKVLMHYTLGCASGGCSDWDYTTQIQLRRETGAIDSNIASIDTITHVPLVLDTTWNVFDVKESLELGRVITPYGGYMATSSNGFNNSWEITHTFDVTDYVHLLKDSVELRAHYSGWSSGFDVTLRFEFVEGTPPRDVLDVTSIWSKSGTYQNTSDFETNVFPAKNIDLNDMAEHYKLRVTTSGHGFDNDVNCAEFCVKDYIVKVNGNPAFTQSMWRHDCGMNPVFPQGGTWIFDRANWCPGTDAPTYEHELDGWVINGNMTSFDFDVEPYSWSGAQAPSHTVDMQLISYGAFNYQDDAEITAIIAPNTQYNYNRYNPICSTPIVEIRNAGEHNLTQVDIAYWVSGGDTCWYAWTGDLAYGESEEVVLPNFSWNGLNPVNPKFFAMLQYPNNTWDENPSNNVAVSFFEIPDMMPSEFVIRMRTNLYPNENYWQIFDDMGNVVHDFYPTTVNTTYDSTVSLSPGCYKLVITDTEKDGMNDWPLGQGNGLIQLREVTATPPVIMNFQRDFGTRIEYQFTVGYETGAAPSTPTCTKPLHPNLGVKGAHDVSSYFDVYPNPASGAFEVALNIPTTEDVSIRIYDLAGKEVALKEYKNVQAETLEFNTTAMQAGTYFVELSTPLGQSTQKLVVIK